MNDFVPPLSISNFKGDILFQCMEVLFLRTRDIRSKWGFMWKFTCAFSEFFKSYFGDIFKTVFVKIGLWFIFIKNDKIVFRYSFIIVGIRNKDFLSGYLIPHF